MVTTTFQKILYGYVPSYAATRLRLRSKIRLGLHSFKLHYISKGMFSSTSQATLTFQDTQLRLRSKIRLGLRSFKLHYNIKRYAFKPESSYAYVQRYAATFMFQDATLQSKICLRSKRCQRSKLHSYSAALTDLLMFLQVTL